MEERPWSPYHQIIGQNGNLGALKIANQVAAYLTDWKLYPASAPGSWVFTAHAFDVNRFLMAQGPDTLWLQFGPQRYRWKGVTLELGGDQVLRGTLVGRPEVR